MLNGDASMVMVFCLVGFKALCKGDYIIDVLIVCVGLIGETGRRNFPGNWYEMGERF